MRRAFFVSIVIASGCGDDAGSDKVSNDTVVGATDVMTTDSAGADASPDTALDTQTADATDTADTGPFPVRPMIGSSGGPIAGEMEVEVSDFPSWEPLAGVTVTVLGTDLVGTTSADGKLKLTNASLAGPVDVKLTAPGRTFRVLYGVNAKSSHYILPVRGPLGGVVRMTGTVDLSDLPPAPASGARVGIAATGLASPWFGEQAVTGRHPDTLWPENRVFEGDNYGAIDRYAFDGFFPNVTGVAIIAGAPAAVDERGTFEALRLGWVSAYLPEAGEYEVPRIKPESSYGPKTVVLVEGPRGTGLGAQLFVHPANAVGEPEIWFPASFGQQASSQTPAPLVVAAQLDTPRLTGALEGAELALRINSFTPTGNSQILQVGVPFPELVGESDFLPQVAASFDGDDIVTSLPAGTRYNMAIMFAGNVELGTHVWIGDGADREVRVKALPEGIDPPPEGALNTVRAAFEVTQPVTGEMSMFRNYRIIPRYSVSSAKQ